MMEWTQQAIAASGTNPGLIYSLAVPMDVLRKRFERRASIAAIADSPRNEMWLKIENFGDDATGEKTVAYIEACRDFHERNIPVVGDHLGGLPGLGAFAFGAVGGIVHGAAMLQAFKASGRRKTPVRGRGGPSWRVYFLRLDQLVKPDAAHALLATSLRIRGRYGCRHTHCCPHGIQNMIDRPARHALYQRTREVERLSATPQTIRVTRYLDERVRRVSDDVAAIAGVTGPEGKLRKSLIKKQGKLSRFRQAMAHLSKEGMPASVAVPPGRRAVRGDRVTANQTSEATDDKTESGTRE